MQKKFLITLFLIIMIICTFTLKSYASTDYSVKYGDGTYRLSFSFKEKTHLDLPDVLVNLKYNTPEIYFFIKQYPEGSSYDALLYTSSQPFIAIQAYDGIRIKTENDSKFKVTHLKDGKWTTDTTKNYSHILIGSDNGEIVMSSDNILLNNEILYYSYTKSSLVKTARTLDFSGVLHEVFLIIPVTLTILICIISIRKGINFIKRKAQNA